MSALIIASKFTAKDAYSRVVQKMSLATKTFAKRSQASFEMVQRAERKLIATSNKLLGTFGKIGLAMTALMLISSVARATIDLDKNLASLSAITGVTGAAFDEFKTKIDEVATAQRIFKGDVAKAFEVVGSAKPELLASADALAKVTEATIILSKAARMELEPAALSLTGVMNQFNLGADEATRTMNVLAAGSVVGSASIANVSESMKNFGAVAAGANITLEQSVALVEVMSSKSIFGAEAGTKLRGSILKLQKAGLGYKSGLFNINDALAEAQVKLESLSSARAKDAFLNKTFGAENVTTGRILLNNTEMFVRYTKGVTGTNTVVEQAAINSRTLSTRISELQASFINAITGVTGNNFVINIFIGLLGVLADNMGFIIGVVGTLVIGYVALKTIMFATNAITTVSNIVLGIHHGILGKVSLATFTNVKRKKAFIVTQKIMTLFTKKGTLALIWQKAAMVASTVATYAMAAATWVLNAAMNANPIFLIITAIALLVAAIVVLITHWESIVDWVMTSNNIFAQFIRVGVNGLIIAFNGVSDAIDWVIDKFEQLFGWISRTSQAVGGFFSDVGGFFSDVGESVGDFFTGSDDDESSGSRLNPDAALNLFRMEFEKTRNDKIDININDATGRATLDDNSSDIPVKITPTLGFFGS